MKKKSSLFLTAIMLSFVSLFNVTVKAGNPAFPSLSPSMVELSVRYDDPSLPITNPQRTPVLVPEVGLDDHTIIFFTPCDNCVLRLVNEDGEVEYSTVIPSNCTSLVLPSDLEGEYELQIIQDNLCFYGIIEF
jgi:hypothetical protein